jgi:hypothetical protein
MNSFVDEKKYKIVKDLAEKSEYPKITIEEKICIKFKLQDIMNKNLHVNETTFEGWLFALRDCISDSDKKIKMSLDKEIKIKDCRNKSKYIGETKLNRFLYRVMRFREQYEWFELEDKLGKSVDDFKSYISKGVFTNNIGAGKANKSVGDTPENYVEGVLAEKGKLKEIITNVDVDIDIGDNNVNRQLPVGLFADKVTKTETPIFTHGHSAIDLWTWNGDEFYVVELKAHNNNTLEIFSEIFFYTNFIRDLLCPEGIFTLNEDKEYIKKRLYCDKKNKEERLRGYDHLRENKGKIKKINGILLADNNIGFHIFVNDNILKIMNNNNASIKYYCVKYDDNIIPKK